MITAQRLVERSLASFAPKLAVIDALSPLGIRHLDMPYTPQTVWRAMQSAKGGLA